MFRIHKTLDIITLFHKPSLQSSTRVLNLLRTASAEASEVANTTLDQASDVSSASSPKPIQFRDDFELEVTESLPTPEQLDTILDYLGQKGIKPSAVIEGAATKEAALRKLSQEGFPDDGFTRPIVVDWNNGRAVAGEHKSEILGLLRKENDSI